MRSTPRPRPRALARPLTLMSVALAAGCTLDFEDFRPYTTPEGYKVPTPDQAPPADLAPPTD
ncbi:MAG: hypothetical protein FJ138_19135, partial [Deltaproteobacteria bacterium]|nr:hypothetical protein [Deltaproteobacteria bacterium]